MTKARIDATVSAVQSTEEAVVNALVGGKVAPTVTRTGKTCRALDLDRMRAIVATSL